MSTLASEGPQVQQSRVAAGAVTASPAIRVLTLNAHRGFSALRRRNVLSNIRDGLRTHAADLVFLQEVGGEGEPGGSTHHYEMLADEVWPQYAYGRNAVSSGGHHGNALLSKFPILSWQNIDVSVGTTERRGMLHCVVEVPPARKSLHAVCVHFGLREAQRRVQTERLLDLVNALPSDAALVIAGDFNDWRGRAHRRLHEDPSIAEIHASATGRLARTFPARRPLLRLDRIYVRNLQHQPMHLPRQPWGALSDHLPLAGEVRFPV